MEHKRCLGCMSLKTGSPICEHCGHDERIPNAPHQLPKGTVLRGQYMIGRALGQGGFGITYLGRDMDLDIPVAIKEYYPRSMVSREASVSHSVTLSLADSATLYAENRERFLREARTLARLEDVPEVVQVKHFFSENNTAYIVMGYVRGITLKDHIQRGGGKLSSRETFQLLNPLLKALSRVHAAGLVHRDISPDNIMITPEGQVRLIDFGAAHAANITGDNSTQAVLKHGFAPPEQYQRKGQLGPWTDVYAICATVYNCLTGLTPPAATDRIMGAEDFEWETISGITARQRAALQRGLMLPVSGRIQSMQDLCDQLFAEQPPEPQPRPAAPEVSESGTITLGKGIELPPFAAPVKQPIYTAPVKQPVYTAPVEKPAYSAPVEEPEIPKETLPVFPEEEAIKSPSPENHRVNPKRKWLLIAAALVALIVIGIQLITQSAGDKMVPIPDGSRVLMEAEPDTSVFGTGAMRYNTVSITLLNTAQAPQKAVDVSQNGDGSVVAWVESKNGMYDLYIAANGTIIAPENCYHMFDGYRMETLDLSGLDTRNVTNMDGMFMRCDRLRSLNISGWNTGNVTNMSRMFIGCSSLTELDAPGFDTRNVTQYESFMNPGVVVNGRPWEELFR